MTARVERAEPVGLAAHRAAELLCTAAPGIIRIDERTATMLASRFYIGADDCGAYLGRPRAYQSESRLMGKPSQWVGRRRELADLVATLRECIENEIAQAVLVTGAAGMGKSRLGAEFMSEFMSQASNAAVMYGRGDAACAGSPFIVLAPALRSLAGIIDSEPIDTQRQKLYNCISRAVGKGRCIDVIPFIGDVIGVPACSGAGHIMRAAERDPVFRGELTTAAIEEWLSAECAERPILMFLEDLHWGDLPSVRCVDKLLATLCDRPFMVLALARPNIHTVFPRLWTQRRIHEIPLHPLSQKESGELVRNALGQRVDDDTMARIVARGAGNAFYLEELVRAVASDGDPNALPDTILGIAQTRLDRLGVEAKRILRAASVFGEIFWQAGVEMLMGQSDVFEVREWLSDLDAREVVRPSPDTYLPGQVEYKFTHALTRDAAYAMLTTDDRRLGHALAGKWLIAVGERDQLIIAEHLARGGEHACAIAHYHRAAEQALQANDLAAAVARAERAIECGASGQTLGELRTLQATAAFWLAELEKCQEFGCQAADILTPGSAAWFTALGHAISASHRLGQYDRGDELFARATAVRSAPEAVADQLICLSRGVCQLFIDGQFRRGEAILAQIEALVAAAAELDQRTLANVHSARFLQSYVVGDCEAAFDHADRSIAAFEAAGDRHNTWVERNSRNLNWARLGLFERAAEHARYNLEALREYGSRTLIIASKTQLGYFLIYLPGCIDEAEKLLHEVLVEHRAAGNNRMEGWVNMRLAQLELARGRCDEAEKLAVLAIDILSQCDGFLFQALATHASAVLGAKRYDLAIEQAQAAISVLHRIGRNCPDDTRPFLVLAKSLDATGDREGARAALRDGVRRLSQQAERITKPEWRDSFLAIPLHREVAELAEKWRA